MNRLFGVLHAVCEESGDAPVPLDTRLKELPGWDSMRAVNFQLELESAFSVDLSAETIVGSATLGEIVQLLERKGVVLS
jgi:acyl carrier protein